MKMKIFCAFRNSSDNLFCASAGKLLELAVNEWLEKNPNPKQIIAQGEQFVTLILMY